MIKPALVNLACRWIHTRETPGDVDTPGDGVGAQQRSRFDNAISLRRSRPRGWQRDKNARQQGDGKRGGDAASELHCSPFFERSIKRPGRSFPGRCELPVSNSLYRIRDRSWAPHGMKTVGAHDIGGISSRSDAINKRCLEAGAVDAPNALPTLLSSHVRCMGTGSRYPSSVRWPNPADCRFPAAGLPSHRTPPTSPYRGADPNISPRSFPSTPPARVGAVRLEILS